VEARKGIGARVLEGMRIKTSSSYNRTAPFRQARNKGELPTANCQRRIAAGVPVSDSCCVTKWSSMDMCTSRHPHITPRTRYVKL
jgi:hypothetical protein